MNLSLNNAIVLDLGTTTLAGRLVAADGVVKAERRVANPQRELAADILTRLQSAYEGGGNELQSCLVRGVRELVAGLLDVGGCPAEGVVSVAAAGNPGMACLLLGRSVERLLFPPHKAPYAGLLSVPGEVADIGLPVPLQLFPPVSGFVGGDLVACLLSLGEVAPGTLLIDVGTNAELALWDGGRWWVTSAAAGPAFEGGNINSGMTMQEGAVVDVHLTDDRLLLEVVGNGLPVGICGSGLAALIAAARCGGLIDAAGRILAPCEVATNLSRYLVEEAGGWTICYYRSAAADLRLTQADVRNFQLAKGAVLAGIQLLLSKAGLAPDDVYRIVITGALGTSLPGEVLKRVALLPEPMLDRTSFVANGVLAGLQTYLQAADGRERLETLLQAIQPFPLSGTPAFEKLFLASLDF